MRAMLNLAASAFFIAAIFVTAHAQTNGDKSLEILTGDKIAGAWRINYAESEDPLAKMPTLLQNRIAPSAGENSVASEESALPAMSISLVPPETLIIVGGEQTTTINEGFNEIVLTRTFTTDGKTRAGEFQGANFLIQATRNRGALKTETVSPRGNKMTETYTLANEGKKLFVAIRFETAQGTEIITLRRVYDRLLIDFPADDAEQIQ